MRAVVVGGGSWGSAFAGSKVGVDATCKHTFPARSVPPQEDLDRVDAHWADYGLQ